MHPSLINIVTVFPHPDVTGVELLAGTEIVIPAITGINY
jgi:hypothetical protein